MRFLINQEVSSLGLLFRLLVHKPVDYRFVLSAGLLFINREVRDLCRFSWIIVRLQVWAILPRL